jgi:hypothetical protein
MQSFLGVGAPEAILVAVVALVVFGPKGLADVSMLYVGLKVRFQVDTISHNSLPALAVFGVTACMVLK